MIIHAAYNSKLQNILKFSLIVFGRWLV